jgi:hypothetical protein
LAARLVHQAGVLQCRETPSQGQGFGGMLVAEARDRCGPLRLRFGETLPEQFF